MKDTIKPQAEEFECYQGTPESPQIEATNASRIAISQIDDYLKAVRQSDRTREDFATQVFFSHS